MKRLWVLIIAALMLAGCMASPAETESFTVDGVTITMAVPANLRALDQYSFPIQVTGPDGPLDGALVSLQVDMPNMPMGINRTLAVGRGGGQYQADGVLFTMGGRWELRVRAEKDGHLYEAAFEREVREAPGP